jgi:hypothetical protein
VHRSGYKLQSTVVQIIRKYKFANNMLKASYSYSTCSHGTSIVVVAIDSDVVEISGSMVDVVKTK